MYWFVSLGIVNGTAEFVNEEVACELVGSLRIVKGVVVKFLSQTFHSISSLQLSTAEL